MQEPDIIVIIIIVIIIIIIIIIIITIIMQDPEEFWDRMPVVAIGDFLPVLAEQAVVSCHLLSSPATCCHLSSLYLIAMYP